MAALLEAGDASRREDLNRIVGQVHAEALKRRAARLGRIEEVQERQGEGGEYELVIRLRSDD